MKKIAVVLSGCGNKDGSEIQEAVSLIINLSQLDASVTYFAPNIEFTPVDFMSNKPIHEKRNIMIESARITRSQIQDLATLKSNNFDAIALPGGLGASTHLSTWAKLGAKCTVLPFLEQALLDFHSESKPIAAICIAPTIVARVLGSKKITLTIGDDKETISEILKTGALHEKCPVDDFVTDREHKVISTPAYMYDAKAYEIFKGIAGLCQELVEMA